MKTKMMTLLGLVLLGSICSAEVVWDEDFESKSAFKNVWDKPAGWSLVKADIQDRKSTVLDIKGGGENLSTLVFPFQNFDYEADFRIVNGYGGFIFRAQDGGNLYMIQFGGGNSYFCPHTMKNGSYHYSRVPLASAIPLGQWRHIKFEIRGQNIKCYLGENPKRMKLAGDWTGKESYTGGRIGFRCVGGEHMQVDNVRISTSDPILPNLELNRSSLPRLLSEGVPFDLKLNMQNTGWKDANNIRVTLSLPDGLALMKGAVSQSIRNLKAGGQSMQTWRLQATRAATGKIKFVVSHADQTKPQTLTMDCMVQAALPTLPARPPVKAYIEVDDKQNLVLSNQHLCMVFPKNRQGYTALMIYVYDGDQWKRVAVSQPIGHRAYRSKSGEKIESAILPTRYEILANYGSTAQLQLTGQQIDVDGTTWNFSFTYQLDSGAKMVQTQYQTYADKDCELLYFQGPDLYAGEGSFGSAKTQALFGGLEYLEAGEKSSSDRDMVPAIANRYAPHPYKVCMPVMAMEADNCLVGLMWDQLQKWDGERYTLSARFASPNWKDAQENHLLGLFLPTIPDFVPENSDRATKPYPLKAHQNLRLKAFIVADYGSKLIDIVDHFLVAFGPMEHMILPESYDEILEKCRVGYMKTMWDPKVVGTKHWDGGPAKQFPNACAILWSDAVWTKDPEVKKQQKERVQLIVNKALETKGADGLVDPIDTRAFGTLPCHIRGYFLPMYIGHLEEGLEAWKKRIYTECIDTQNPDGSWDVAGAERCLQGEEIVSGTVAEFVGSVLMYARVTGDERVLKAGLKGLKFLDTLDVPRGAQVWEVPKFTPDILASGHAMWAYLEAYQITGDSQYLDRAKYWGKTVFPFVYLWQAPDVKLMESCTIAVFGTTFYTGSWFGRPVQWCGLVPGYWLIKLEEYDQSYPWRDNAMQQMLNLWKTHPGTYTDSIGMIDDAISSCKFEPESMMKPLFLLRDQAVEVNTKILKSADTRIHISTAARLQSAKITEEKILRAEIEYPINETSYAVVTGLKPNIRVNINGSPLKQTEDLESVAQGWKYTQSGLLLKINHRTSQIQLEIMN